VRIRTKFRSLAGVGSISRRADAGALSEKTATLPSASRGDWVDALIDNATMMTNGRRNQMMTWPERTRGSSCRTRLHSVRVRPPGGGVPAGGTSPRKVARASRNV
jgi:hypothetical protein